MKVVCIEKVEKSERFQNAYDGEVEVGTELEVRQFDDFFHIFVGDKWLCDLESPLSKRHFKIINEES